MNVLKRLTLAVVMLPAWILMDLSHAPAILVSLAMDSTAQVYLMEVILLCDLYKNVYIKISMNVL